MLRGLTRRAVTLFHSSNKCNGMIKNQGTSEDRILVMIDEVTTEPSSLLLSAVLKYEKAIVVTGKAKSDVVHTRICHRTRDGKIAQIYKSCRHSLGDSLLILC